MQIDSHGDDLIRGSSSEYGVQPVALPSPPKALAIHDDLRHGMWAFAVMTGWSPRPFCMGHVSQVETGAQLCCSQVLEVSRGHSR